MTNTCPVDVPRTKYLLSGVVSINLVASPISYLLSLVSNDLFSIVSPFKFFL